MMRTDKRLVTLEAIFTTTDRRQSQTLLTADERGSKSIKTVFSIAICRQSGDKWQSKTLFLIIFFIQLRR